jgi:hypothetical protein
LQRGFCFGGLGGCLCHGFLMVARWGGRC